MGRVIAARSMFGGHVMSSIPVRLIAVLVLAMVVGLAAHSPRAVAQRSDGGNANSSGRLDLTEYPSTDGVTTATRAQLRARAATVDDLNWLPISGLVSRADVLSAKSAASAAGDREHVARLNGRLMTEAANRAAPVVQRWLDRRDPVTGLFLNPREGGRVRGWFYEDTASDLFPHIVIGTSLLYPARFGEVRGIVAAERRLDPPGNALPNDVVTTGTPSEAPDDESRVFGAAEYAKDGLVSLVERLGPGPWSDRLVEIVDEILANATTPTSLGPIPGDSNETNGDVLQVLVRLYWLTGDGRYYDAADRIGRAYVEDMLGKTNGLPTHEWDFIDGQPIGRRRLRLSDHGNEILGGLVGWHMMETMRGDPDTSAHREVIRRMLDRILERGRNPDGLWYRVMNVPTGKVDQPGLTDNWGYLYQVILAQAAVERFGAGGDVGLAIEYEREVRDVLDGLRKYEFYPWQRGEMDGYADSIEGALYLLSRVPSVEARAWVDTQIPVLYSFQEPDYSIDDDHLDGNFVRTTMLYALSLTGGAWIEPWRSDVAIGAVVGDGCMVAAVESARPWLGRLRLDAPRHRTHLRLPFDLPRLNEWPEWFTIEPGVTYRVRVGAGDEQLWDGGQLAQGLPIDLHGGAHQSITVCRRDA
jgi:hypothetical protein